MTKSVTINYKETKTVTFPKTNTYKANLDELNKVATATLNDNVLEITSDTNDQMTVSFILEVTNKKNVVSQMPFEVFFASSPTTIPEKKESVTNNVLWKSGDSLFKDVADIKKYYGY